MARDQGLMLQRYRDGSLSDAISFVLAEGLSRPMGGDSGRTRTETDLAPWRVARGAAGRMPPTGFPRSNRFRCAHFSTPGERRDAQECVSPGKFQCAPFHYKPKHI